DPQQIVLALRLERESGLDSGMGEEISAPGIAELGCLQEAEMRGRKSRSERVPELPRIVEADRQPRRQAVGQQRLEPAEPAPIGKHPRLMEKVEHRLLVIAAQAVTLAGNGGVRA